MTGGDWTFGFHAVGSLLNERPEAIERVLLLGTRRDRRAADLRSRCAVIGIPIEETTRRELTALVGGGHQGVAARHRQGGHASGRQTAATVKRAKPRSALDSQTRAPGRHSTAAGKDAQPGSAPASERQAQGRHPAAASQASRHQPSVSSGHSPTERPKTEKELLATLGDGGVTPTGEDTLLLALDGVTDPRNLGACLRAAAAAGVTAVIMPRNRAAPLTATARKVASGAAEVLPVITVTNLARCLGALRERGLWIVGMAADGTVSLYETDLRGPLAIVMGGEGRGLRRLTRAHCDYLAAIPMTAAVGSLNVAVAAGVCLFEVRRQRRAANTPPQLHVAAAVWEPG